MKISESQKDMREAYFGGAPSAISSASIWLLAAIVALFHTSKAAMLTLIFGGMLIFPLSVVLCKILGRSGRHRKDNPLASLAFEGTIWMLLCIPLAVMASLYRVELFFPAMIFVIGGRYLTFKTLYGMKLYWIFGAVLSLSAVILMITEASTSLAAFTGSIIEFAFGIAIVLSTVSSQKKGSTL